MKKLILGFFLISASLSFGENVTAPRFSIKDQYSKVHSLKDYKGKKVFLTFLATWCGASQEEMEDIKKLYEETGSNTKDTIFLTFVNEEKDEIEKFLKDNKYSFPVMNNKNIFHQYYIDAYPTTYVINQEGEVVQSIRGRIGLKDFRELLQNINYKIIPIKKLLD